MAAGSWFDNIVLVEDKRPGRKGHFMIAPHQSMPLKKYLGLLEELGLDRSRVELVKPGAISNVG